MDCGDTSNRFAREGTAAHILGQRALECEKPAEFFRNEVIAVEYEEDGETKLDNYVVDDEFIDNVQVYLDAVNREPGELLVEQKFDLSEVYCVKEQFGTGDAVKLNYEAEQIVVGDLKYGRGEIVYAKDNDQLYSYGAGALKEYDILCDWKTIKVVVHQPRLNHYDEHIITREELEAWMTETQGCAAKAMVLVGQSAEIIEQNKTAGEKQCQWCPIKGDCQTLAKFTHESVYKDFVALGAEPAEVVEAVGIPDDLLGKLLHRADIIVAATKAWREEAFRRVQSGTTVPGWKMVDGKKGARQWGDEAEAEAIMKAARIKADDMYNKKLITLPAAEKILKKKKPKVWAKLLPLQVQKDGSPSLAPDTDRRPSLVVPEEAQFKPVDDPDLAGLI